MLKSFFAASDDKVSRQPRQVQFFDCLLISKYLYRVPAKISAKFVYSFNNAAQGGCTQLLDVPPSRRWQQFFQHRDNFIAQCWKQLALD
jgi:hypothetical protein